MKKPRKPKPYRWGRMTHYPQPFQHTDLYLTVEEANLKETKLLKNWLERVIVYLEARK